MRSERTATKIELNCKEKGYGALGIGGTSNCWQSGQSKLKFRPEIFSV